MQSRRQYGSSGELDVFGATRYFDGLADRATGPIAVREPAQDLTIQVKMTYDKKMEESYHVQLGVKTRSKLAAFFGSLVSPEASFRKKPPPAASTPPAGEPPKVSSSSSRGSSDVTAAAAASMQSYGHDLGVVMGDRRLQGVRVVRGSGDEERWVVRCSAWEEEHHEKMFDAASSDDHRVGEEDGWESDSSSDLFELELKIRSSQVITK